MDRSHTPIAAWNRNSPPTGSIGRPSQTPVNDDLPLSLATDLMLTGLHAQKLSNHSCMSRRNGPISGTHCRMIGNSPPTGVFGAIKFFPWPIFPLLMVLR